MHLTLSELDKDIVVVSDTAEQWATTVNVLTINGWKPVSDNNDDFENYPSIIIYNDGEKEYLCVSKIQSSTVIKSRCTATEFIAANTPADTTTNTNDPQQHSMNC